MQLLISCSTPGGLTVPDVDRPLLDLQRIASKSLPMGLRSVSTNGREYFSKYFIVVGRKFKSAEKLVERKYAHLLVLGDRRPYTIQVIVPIEKSIGGKTVIIGTDSAVAEVIRKRIRQQLTLRREDPNIIDEFRAF